MLAKSPPSAAMFSAVEPSLPSAQSSHYQAVANPAVSSRSQSHHKTRLLRDIAFLGFTIGFLAVIIAYFCDYRNTAFNRFFNSDRFGPRFTLSILATLLDNHWKTMEREVRITVPYRRLAAGNARAKDTVLATMNGTPYTSVGTAVWRGNWFHAFIALVAVLSDFLIVSVAGVPYSDAQLHLAFLVSSYVSFGILSLMLIAMIAGLWWRRGNAAMGLPRQPDTMLGVILMLCGKDDSVRNTGSVACSSLSTRGGHGLIHTSLESEVRYSGRWIRESDGRERWTISRQRGEDLERFY